MILQEIRTAVERVIRPVDGEAKKMGVSEDLVSIKVWSSKGYEQSVKTRGEKFITNQ